MHTSTRCFAADVAFASYDFGPKTTVQEKSGWDYSDNQWTRAVYVRLDDDDDDAATYKINFNVFFFTSSADVMEAYAIDSFGHLCGTMGKIAEKSPRELESEMVPRCPKPGQVERLYASRDKYLDMLRHIGKVTMDDLANLDRAGRCKVAADHWQNCSPVVQIALIDDQHHQVRSCAACSVYATNRSDLN